MTTKIPFPTSFSDITVSLILLRQGKRMRLTLSISLTITEIRKICANPRQLLLVILINRKQQPAIFITIYPAIFITIYFISQLLIKTIE